MKLRQMLSLLVCNMVIYAGLGGLVGLLPVYLDELGADSALIGLFLAAAYFALAVSSVVAGQLADLFQQRRRLLLLGGLAAVPITALMSQTTNVPLLMLLMVCLWFVTGIAMMMLNILIGLSSPAHRQGMGFGLLVMSNGLGLFLGSVAGGWIVDRWNFPMLFLLLALAYGVIPLVGLLVEERTAQLEHRAIDTSVRAVFAHRTFALLFIAEVMVHATNIVILLARPLIMDKLLFSATAIGTAAGIGSLITLPLPLIVGWLADRMGRKPLMLLCFAAPAVGTLLLIPATTEWQFWLTSVFGNTVGVALVVGSTLVVEWFPKRLLGTSLAVFNATPWIGIVFGFSAGGAAIRSFDMTVALLLAVVPNLIGIGMLARLPLEAARVRQDAA